MTLNAGTRIGPYEVISLLGQGGMGQVYRARDTKLGRDVALKVLPELFAGDDDRLARFRREAQVLAALNHPNIAHVYGVEDEGQVHALVMEFVAGRTLAEMLSAGGLGLDDALPIARQIAEALETAHDQGIVHRDLKPANIKVTGDGIVKVLDFGLAKTLAPEGSGSASDAMNSPTLTARGTQLGVILGTAAYMAPEQAKGRTVDRRADIWAFGIVLYEMLTGRRAYEAEDVAETLAAVLTRDVDVRALPPDTPPRLAALIADCLVRDPKHRLRDIGEARRVIDQLVTGSTSVAGLPSHVGISAPPGAPDVRASGPAAVARPPWRLLPWAITALAIIVAAVSASGVWRAADPPRVVTRSRTALPALSGFVALSRDGSQLVYTVTGGADGFRLDLRRMQEFEARPIAGATGALFPIFSPDAQWVAYTSATQPVIRKIATTGGTPVDVADGTFATGADWGDDDTMVFSGPQGLRRVPASGGTPATLTTVDAGKKEQAHINPQFLPGGRQVLFTILSAVDPPQFAVLDLERRTHRTVARGGDNGRYLASGHLTFGRGGTLYAIPFELDSQTTTGSEVPVLSAISATGPPGTADYTVSDSGLLVYSEAMAESGTLLAWADAAGGIRPMTGQRPREWGTGRLSPDGRWVANSIDNDKGVPDIWVVDVERGTPTRLSFSGGAHYPIWTPDSRRIVYAASVDGKPALYIVPADGSGAPQKLADTSHLAVPSSITPDGRTLLFGERESLSRILTLPLTGSTPAVPQPLHAQVSGGEGGAQVSPNGRYLAYESNESNSREIYVRAFAGGGGKTRISPGGGRWVRWAPDSRTLYYWSNTPGSASLYAVDLSGDPAPRPSVPRELFRLAAGTTWDVGPDGRFLVEVTRVRGDQVTAFITVTDWFEELRQRAPVKR